MARVHRPAVRRFGFSMTALLFWASGLGRISHPGATADLDRPARLYRKRYCILIQPGKRT